MTSELHRALIAGAGGMLAWGGADFLVAKTIKAHGTGERIIFFWMYAIGVLFLVPFMRVSSMPVMIWLALAGLALLNMMAYLLFFRALRVGEVSVISPLVAAYGGLSAVFSALFFHEAISQIRWIILFVIFVGTVLVSSTGRVMKSKKGVPAAAGALILFALFFPLWDTLLATGYDEIYLIVVVHGLTVVFLFLYSLIAGIQLKIVGRSVSLLVVGIALLDSIASASTAWGFATTSYTSIVAVLSAALFLPAALLGHWLLHERIRPYQWIGILLILVGGSLLILT